MPLTYLTTVNFHFTMCCLCYSNSLVFILHFPSFSTRIKTAHVNKPLRCLLKYVTVVLHRLFLQRIILTECCECSQSMCCKLRFNCICKRSERNSCPENIYTQPIDVHSGWSIYVFRSTDEGGVLRNYRLTSLRIQTENISEINAHRYRVQNNVKSVKLHLNSCINESCFKKQYLYSKSIYNILLFYNIILDEYFWLIK